MFFFFWFVLQPADASFSVNVEEHDLCFPKHLKLYTYERGNITKLPRPRKDANGLLSKFLCNIMTKFFT